jgi:hypothetical protein
MLTKRECKTIAKQIKAGLEERFPGYVVKKVVVKPDQEYTVISDERKSLPDYYHLYPGLTRPQADDQLVRDMEAVIRQYLPKTRLVDFDQNAHDGPRHVELGW